MPDIFTYTDYRAFLTDYYYHHKAINPAFSYQYLADKAGFTSRGYLHNIISGLKNLGKSATIKLTKALSLNVREADYFENLVSFNQALTLDERNYFFNKLNVINSNRRNEATISELRKEHHEFYSAWYMSVIRSLIDMHPFSGDYTWLADNVFPRIKPREAQRSVELLEKLGMIQQNKDGHYSVTNKTITAGPEIVQLGLQNFQIETNRLAEKAIRELPRNNRHISGLTLGISRSTYETICNEICTFQDKLLALAEQDSRADNVYQLNIHLFPVSCVQSDPTAHISAKK